MGPGGGTTAPSETVASPAPQIRQWLDGTFDRLAWAFDRLVEAPDQMEGEGRGGPMDWLEGTLPCLVGRTGQWEGGWP